jgi:hypothetical protein
MNIRKLLSIICSVSLLSCCQKDCEDEILHDFTETELEWFSYSLFDTMHFQNEITGDIYYLTCISEATRIVTDIVTEESCPDGGWNLTYPEMQSEFSSDLPHFDKDTLNISLLIYPGGDSYLSSDITFITPTGGYTYYSGFDNKDEILKNKRPGWSEVVSKGTLFINGESYENVYAIRWIEDPERIHLAYYDSIYYNKDGFLKFISSQHGYVLERLP